MYKTLTITQRSRFIYCAAAVYGMPYVAKSLNFSTETLEENFPVLLYSSELESLHLLYSTEMISKENLLELIHSMICNKSNNSKVRIT